ncbi:MAG: ribbon-helix-helix protein, CopG family [Thermoanaerobaculia bacterium]
MSTNMHRLQISLPEWQTDFLAAQARREGVSMAEVVRRLIQREAETARRPVETSSLWDIAGIGEDQGPLIQNVPVSENPELYLTAPPPRPTRRR